MSHKITLIKSTTKCLFIDLREAKKKEDSTLSRANLCQYT